MFGVVKPLRIGSESGQIGKFVILGYGKNLFMEYATYICENPAKLHRRNSAKSVPGKNPRKSKSSVEQQEVR
jgi:hypothetical protein